MQIDFGTNRELDGPATAVGTSRTIKMGRGDDAPKIVEIQVAREVGVWHPAMGRPLLIVRGPSVCVAAQVTPTKLSFSYEISNADNPFGAVGYRADVTVFASSEDSNVCFCTWRASWDSAAAAIESLPGVILSSIKRGEKKASAAAKM